jgi:hypothetical protein
MTVSVALSGAVVEDGEKVHEPDCGAPVQEKETEPLNVPFTGCTLKANCAGCPAWTVRDGVNATILKSAPMVRLMVVACCGTPLVSLASNGMEYVSLLELTGTLMLAVTCTGPDPTLTGDAGLNEQLAPGIEVVSQASETLPV